MISMGKEINLQLDFWLHVNWFQNIIILCNSQLSEDKVAVS